MATKPPPPRPAPRIYLATPIVADPAQIASDLPALLAAADVAAVLLRLAPGDERSIIQRTKILAPVVQKADAALLIDQHFAQVARGGADGANVSGIEAMQEAMPSLPPGRIPGGDGLPTRPEAKVPGEAGADHVLLGEPNAKGDRPSPEAIVERLQWWSELYEPPCVGFARTGGEAGPVASAADFVMVGDLVWEDTRGAKAALLDVSTAVTQGYKTSLAAATEG